MSQDRRRNEDRRRSTRRERDRSVFYLYVFPTGARIGTLRDVDVVEARELRDTEERERGETVVLYNRLHEVVA